MTLEFTLDNIEEAAKKILPLLTCDLVLFEGGMGVGKTTFIKMLTKIMGVDDRVNSPTFSLVNEYVTSTNQIIYHFDLYRLNTEEEAVDIGIEEYFDSGNYCFIEWPSKIQNLLPLEVNRLKFSDLGDGVRQIVCQ